MELTRPRPFRPVVDKHDAERQREADALTAAGDPRGRFVTVQLALEVTDPESETFRTLSDEERWLLARHGEEWAERLGLRLNETEWARGAVERASLTWSRFLIVGPQILATARPRTLSLHGPRRDIAFLARCEAAGCVERLDLSGRLTADEITVLVESPYFASLLALDVEIDTGGARALAAASSPALKCLRTLGLTGSKLDVEAVEALASASWFPQMEELLWEFSSLPEEALIALVRTAPGICPPLALRQLDLNVDGLRPEGAAAVAGWPGLSSVEQLLLENDSPLRSEAIAALVFSPHLGRLTDLQLNVLRGAPGSMAQLASSPLLPHLLHVEVGVDRANGGDAVALVGDAFLGFTEVSLYEPFATEAAAAAFASWQGLASVASLTLTGGSPQEGSTVLTAAFLRALGNGPELPEMRRLVFRGCRFEDAAVEALTRLSTFPGLEQLIIEEDFVDPEVIGDDGVALLAAWPGLSSVRWLEITDGRIGHEGARALASSPFLTNLRELDLTRNDLGGEGIAAILRSPALPGLRRLIVSSCCDGDEDMLVIAEALAETRRSLELLSLTWNPIERPGATALGQALARARVRTLDLSVALRLDPFGAAAIARGMWASGGAVLFGESAKRAAPTSEELRSLGGLRGYLDALQTALQDAPGEVLLRALWLSGCELGPNDAAVLAQHPIVASVRDLRLGNNALGPAGASALAASPWLRQLDALSLDDTAITSTGLAALLTSPIVTTVAELRLETISLDEEGALLLASQADRLPALGELQLRENDLGGAGAEALRRAFPNAQLHLP